jgi:hypothetical protein
MGRWAGDRGAAVADDPEVEGLLGPARLASFTPVREYPPLSDRKSVILLTLNGLMLTVMDPFAAEIPAVLQGNPVVKRLAIAAGLSWFSLLILGACYAFRALTRPIPPMGDCAAFYPNIAATSLGSYRQNLERLSHRGALRDILNYNYSIAVLSQEKFRLIRKSVLCLCPALPLWMLLMLMISLRAVNI